MSKVETILEQANGLSPVEREQLLRRLLEEAFTGAPEDEARVGRRGLSAWTESTRGEDWSMYYPESLRNGGSTHS